MIAALEAGVLYLCVLATLGLALKAYQIVNEYFKELALDNVATRGCYGKQSI